MREGGTLWLLKLRQPRDAKFGPHVISWLTVCWTLTRTPARKRLAPMLATIVPLLSRDGDIVMSDSEAALLVSMSAASIDRHLAHESGPS